MALFQKNLPGKIFKKLKLFFKKEKKWQDIEYFDTKWKERIEQMARYINNGSTVMDLGCGPMWLKEYLPSECKYIPVDYCKRSSETIISDFNKKQFPLIIVDIAFISGCLEYILDYNWFLKTICEHSKIVILSYCTTDEFPKMKIRRRNAWVNHLSTENIFLIFQINSFKIKDLNYSQSRYQIFIFEKS